MFGIGVPELVLILIIGLIVFGPGKLPEMGRTLSKGIREFRKASNALSQAMRRAVGTAAGSPCAACGTGASCPRYRPLRPRPGTAGRIGSRTASCQPAGTAACNSRFARQPDRRLSSPCLSGTDAGECAPAGGCHAGRGRAEKKIGKGAPLRPFLIDGDS